MVPYLYSRWNIHSWRDVWEVCCLRLPPYRWYHCIPLTCFSLGIQRPRSGWIIMIGMWGLKFKTREDFPVTVNGTGKTKWLFTDWFPNWKSK